VLWEAATGRRFWRGVTNELQILHALANGELRGLGDMAELPEGLQAVIRGAVAANPEARFASALDMPAALRGWLDSTGEAMPSPREMGRLLQERFANERAQVRQAIEAQLGALRGSPSGEYSQVDLAVIPLAMTGAQPVSGTPSSARRRLESGSGSG